MKIRPYIKDDLKRMKEIAPRAFLGLGLARFAIDRELDRERVADYYSKEIAGYAERTGKEDTIQILVAEEAGLVVAHIVVAVDEANSKQFGVPWGRIISLAVDPDHQGRGIGKSLVASGLAWLSSKGVAYAEVLTDQNNIGAQRVYEASGFRTVYASISYSRRLDPTS